MPTHALPERLTPLASRLGYRAFLGDIHNHCGLSYGHGRLEDALSRARRQLDFVSVTGHAYWPDMPLDDPSVAHIVDFHVKGFARLEKLWPAHFDVLRRYLEPGSFTVFPGYEIHSCAHGDYTIVYRDLDQRELFKADSPRELLAALQARYPGRAMAFPHHIGYRQGARGINWSSFDERLSPVVEMMSMHGCSEASMGDRPFLHSMGPSDGRSTVRHGLGLGHVFGLLGNTDHHSAYPGSYGHGRSAIYASENMAATLWDGINARRTTALTGDCIHLFAAMDGVPQGSIVAPAERIALDIEAVGGSFIDFIDVIRNECLAARITPELDPRPIDASSDRLETQFVLELGWGARGRHHDWEGSIELKGGRILAVEPRFRGPEIVSPLEGKDGEIPEERLELHDDQIHFKVRSYANANNMTPATQAFAARVELTSDAEFHADFNGQKVVVSAARLREGALSGNLGPIDSPAYRFHPLPSAGQWQWRGQVSVDDFSSGDRLYLRLRQANGQWAWTSPFFCRT
ncbi:MAG TPA: hypothetical protein VHC00_16730 [Rhizobiaceae bacterium]|nr:hypothetical protein [Rhizobiaceae bacterium]